MHAVAGAIDVAAGDALVRLHQVEAAALASCGAPRAANAPVAPQRGRYRTDRSASSAASPPQPSARCARSASARRPRARAPSSRARRSARRRRRGCSAGVPGRSFIAVIAPGSAVPAPLRAPRRRRQRGQAFAHLAAAAAVVAAGAAGMTGWRPRGAPPATGPIRARRSARTGPPPACPSPRRCASAAESTPTKRRARAVSAPSSFSVSLPARFERAAIGVFETISSMSDISSASGAAVTTTRSPGGAAGRSARRSAPPAST